MPEPDDRHAALRRLRHDLAGAYNELRLCTEVLRVETDPEQAIEWVDLIERAAERSAAIAEQLEAILD